MRDVIREAENRWDRALPEEHGGFFLRVGDHVSRMTGALAAAERAAIKKPLDHDRRDGVHLS
jgi:hypothetical protein